MFYPAFVYLFVSNFT